MDIVIPLGTGSLFNNLELKYCLRSIEKYATNYSIILVGSIPDWIKDNKLYIIRANDMTNIPSQNIATKIAKYCHNFQVEKDFLLFNDDYILTKEFDVNDNNVYYHKELAYHINKSFGTENEYIEYLMNTYKYLVDNKCPTYNYDIHYPSKMNTQLFKILYESIEWQKKMLVKSTYFNRFKSVPLREIVDVKINKPVSKIELLSLIKNTNCFSYGDNGLDGNKLNLDSTTLIDYLEDNFPYKSKFEK
jgi:hypothetical protein